MPVRAIVIVLDGVGIGALPDASTYGDAGSDTLGHVAAATTIELPALTRLGLGQLVGLGTAPGAPAPLGAFGRLAEASAGKDSVTGHWELMGVVLERAFAVFPDGFPDATMQALARRTGRPVIGNVVASGTEIIERLGLEHLQTGGLIVYTSADSVCQIAAHEDLVPLEDLYGACKMAYELVAVGLGVARVIARPFAGVPGAFRRTAGRRDFAQAPPGATLLDRLTDAGIPVVAIGKVHDLFAGRGISRAIHTGSDTEGMDQVERALDECPAGLIFANLVDFDTVYGHRNDVDGFARNLERFDRRLARILPRLGPKDILIVTADHGNDPTTPGTDHTREYVPLMVVGSRIRAGVDLGTRATFADVGQTLADLFGVAPLAHGTSALRAIITAGETP